MICDQDLSEKMEIIVKLLLSFSVIVFDMMKLLIKTFIMKVYTRIDVFKEISITFCVTFKI